MIKKISYFFYKCLFYLDKFFYFITKKKLLVWFNEFIQKDSYRSIEILNNKVTFFTPNHITSWRIETFFTKEPETLEWIDSFEKKENLNFWDIGANIGLYSIYCSLKYKYANAVSFEPSSSNLRVLTRNISINNLENRIKLFPIPLTDKPNSFQIMNEANFLEGGALNSFGEKYNFEGEEFKPETKYNVFGTSINYLIENKILELPDYIKIDVDGIEHLILKGADNHLKNKKIKSILVEINEKFEEQFNAILKIMRENEFKFFHKKRNEKMFSEDKLSKVFNYVFVR